MASTDQDQNLDQDPAWFLINLIIHTNSGKLVNIDWDEVCQKIDIKTKGAAVKPYERILNSYDLNLSYRPKESAQATGNSPGPAARSSSSAPKRTSSKRKRGGDRDQDDNKAGNTGDA